MKIPSSIASICLAALAIPRAILAAGNTGSLFNGNEFTGSVFGESAEGNVDINYTPTTFHTTTTTVRDVLVSAPGSQPAPSTSPIPSQQPGIRAVKVKKAAAVVG